MEITRGLERDGEAIWLHVEDDGIGMSERTITTPLLDFGKSFWSSDAVMQEFPGFGAKGLSATGRFGVGFFSVFILGDVVRVREEIRIRIRNGRSSDELNMPLRHCIH